jgi:5'-nucleotidase
VTLAASALVDVPASSIDRLVSRRPQKRSVQDNFNITIFHVNDVHAHLDEFNSTAGPSNCTDPRLASECVGGYARIKNTVGGLRPLQNNSLLLNMGDEFEVEFPKYL